MDSKKRMVNKEMMLVSKIKRNRNYLLNLSNYEYF